MNRILVTAVVSCILSGGIGYLLETKYSLVLPPKMREVFGYHVKSVSDHAHKELSAEEVYDIFMKNYVNVEGHIVVEETHYKQIDGITAEVTFLLDGERKVVSAIGNGRLDAVSNAIDSVLTKKYTLENYTEHAIEDGTSSRAASYVAIKSEDGTVTWGAGIDSDIINSSVKALVSAINRMMEH